MKAKKYFLIALAIIVVDQITKVIVKFRFDYHDEPFRVIGDFFKIQFIENKGAAFGLTITKLASGLGMEVSEASGKLALSIFSILAVIAIAYVLYRLADHKSPLPYFVAFIFGGAMGNIIDRTFYGLFFADMNNYTGGLFHGRVVDFFYFDIWEGQIADWIPFFGGSYTSLWPIFNIADSAISIGIVVILLFQGRFFKMDEKNRTEETLAKGGEVDKVKAETEKAPAKESSKAGGQVETAWEPIESESKKADESK